VPPSNHPQAHAHALNALKDVHHCHIEDKATLIRKFERQQWGGFLPIVSRPQSGHERKLAVTFEFRPNRSPPI
jgi:hypothetical protein